MERPNIENYKLGKGVKIRDYVSDLNLYIDQEAEKEWTSIKDKSPLCYETGDWDGKKSDLCLCKDSDCKYHLAHAYQYDDKYIEWYDQDDYGVDDVVKWTLVTE